MKKDELPQVSSQIGMEVDELMISRVRVEAGDLLTAFQETLHVRKDAPYPEELESKVRFLISHAPDHIKEWCYTHLGAYALFGYVKSCSFDNAIELLRKGAELGSKVCAICLSQLYSGMQTERLLKLGFQPKESEKDAIEYGLLSFKLGDQDSLMNLCTCLIEGAPSVKKNRPLFRHIFYELFFDLEMVPDEVRLCETIDILLFFSNSDIPDVYFLLSRWQNCDLWNDKHRGYGKLLKHVFEVHGKNNKNLRLITLNKIFKIMEEQELLSLLELPFSYQDPYPIANIFFGKFSEACEAIINQPSDQFSDLLQGLDLNQSIDDLHNTFLHLAVRKGNEIFVQWLLENGANINAQNSFGETPLLIACELGQLNIVRILLKNNANPEIADELGFQPLHFAAINGHYEITNLLLKAKANCDALLSYTGATPLLLAIKNNHEFVAQLLLQHGADINIKNKRGLGLLNFTKLVSLYLTRFVLAWGIKIPESYEKWEGAPKTIEEIQFFEQIRKKELNVNVLLRYNKGIFPSLRQLAGLAVTKIPNFEVEAKEKLSEQLYHYVHDYLPKKI